MFCCYHGGVLLGRTSFISMVQHFIKVHLVTSQVLTRCKSPKHEDKISRENLGKPPLSTQWLCLSHFKLWIVLVKGVFPNVN
jgi:hypothetical protein